MKPFAFAFCLALAFVSRAQARPDPTPPPSGIVVHLFGQNSVMSNFLPTASASPTAPGGIAGAAAPAGGQNTGYVEPSMGNVLHQMFVTGDPNSPPVPSTGRTEKGLSGG